MSRRPAELVSGVWAGHYEQGGHRFPQQMTLEFADGLVRGDGVDRIGTFVIEGEYRAVDDVVRLGWIKTYDRAHSVLYLGELRERRIVGSWSIRPSQGGFALEPHHAHHTHDHPRSYRR